MKEERENAKAKRIAKRKQIAENKKQLTIKQNHEEKRTKSDRLFNEQKKDYLSVCHVMLRGMINMILA